MTHEGNQQDWIKRLCAGEEEAYRFFFDEYYQILGSFALRYVKEQEIAEMMLFSSYTAVKDYSPISFL